MQREAHYVIIVERISQAVGRALTGVVLVAMVAVIVSDVFLRYFFNRPILGSNEIVGFLMVFVGVLGFAWCALKGRHVSVELVVGRFSKRLQAVFGIINCLIVLGLCGFIGLGNVLQSIVAWEMNLRTTMIRIPHYPFYLIITLGYALLFLAVISVLVHFVAEVKR